MFVTSKTQPLITELKSVVSVQRNILPAVLNILSTGADVAGTIRYFSASFANVG